MNWGRGTDIQSIAQAENTVGVMVQRAGRMGVMWSAFTFLKDALSLKRGKKN